MARAETAFRYEELLPCLHGRNLRRVEMTPLTGPRFNLPNGQRAENGNACYLRKVVTTCLSSAKIRSSNSPW
jgi:hypothetical protein